MGKGNPRFRIDLATSIKGDPYKHYNYNTARTIITKHARKVYDESGRPRVCFFCGYSRFTEVAHRKAVKDFSMEDLISEINHINNLVALCPNHHKEADNGFLDLTAIEDVAKEFGLRGFMPSTDPSARARKSRAKGSVVLRERKRGPNMWVFLYRSGGEHKSLNLGDLEQYPTKEAAQEAAKSLRKTFRKEFVHFSTQIVGAYD
jgi:hypothetical protein